MKRLVAWFSVFSVFLMLVACGDKSSSVYSGFKKTESGAYMNFYTVNKDGQQPRLNDEVTFEMAQFFNDSMLFSTAGDKPLESELKPGDFVGDISDALLAMHVGDSARLVVQSDSVFFNVMQMEVPEEYMGKPIYYDIKLLSIKPLEVIAAEKKAVLDSLRMTENEYLMAFQADPKNTFTESGQVGQNGRLRQI